MKTLSNIFSFCYFFAFVKIRFVKTFRVWKSMTFMPAPFSLAAIRNRKKVCDVLFTDRQLRQIKITEMNVKRRLVTISRHLTIVGKKKSVSMRLMIGLIERFETSVVKASQSDGWPE